MVEINVDILEQEINAEIVRQEILASIGGSVINITWDLTLQQMIQGYIRIAYADNGTWGGFSYDPTDKEYISFLATSKTFDELVPEDFTVWTLFVWSGWSGWGSGDMLQSDYDTNSSPQSNTHKVDRARYADALNETSSQRTVTDTEKTTWNAKQAALWFTPENVANKATNLTSPDNAKYPTTLAITTALANKSDVGHTHAFSAITSKPTTIVGYGITDAYTKTEIDTTVAWLQAQSALLDDIAAITFTTNDFLQYVSGHITNRTPAQVKASLVLVKWDVGLGNVQNVDQTNPSNITQDSTHRFVSDTEKTTRNGKQDALGYTPENLANKDQANGYAGLDSSGKINASQLPAIAITDTFVVVSQAAMLALTAETGDVAIRTDISATYILRGTSASTLADWQLMATPTDSVTSVFGRSGVVTAQSWDYNSDQVTEGSTNLYYTDARARAAAVAQTITNWVTTSAPSQDAVFDALALKSDTSHTHTFSSITSKPTTISGYGITDAYTKTEVDTLLTGYSLTSHTHTFSSITSKPTTVAWYGITDAVTLTGSESLTNKTLNNTNTITLKDTLFTLQDDGDTTKQARFQLSGITTATTRVFTFPDASTTLVGTDTTQTLTNKTLTNPVFTTPTLGVASGTSLVLSSFLNEAKGADIASATTTDIGAATWNYVEVTGTTTITGLGTVQAGTRRIVKFTGALTLTHNATSLILPGSANITTVAGDIGTFVSLGSGNWICVDYLKVTRTGTGSTVLATNPVIVKPQTDAFFGTTQTYSPGVSGTATLTCDLYNKHYITMPAGNITIALSNISVGQCILIGITQDGTGSRTVTWFTTIKRQGGTPPTLTTTANKRDVLGFICTGSGTYDGFIIWQNI